MIRSVTLIVAAAALAACAGGPRGHRGFGRDLKPTANPSAVIAAELAFAREAQEKGQWSAFAHYAADDAVMFVPEPVRAKDWLKKQQNPPRAVTWQPYQVWSSCDGSLAVTKGAFQQPDGTTGYFTTVWQRQKNDQYKWVMDQGDALAQPLPPPEMIAATVADCSRAIPTPATTPLSGTTHGGAATDATLHWSVTAQVDGARSVTVSYWNGTSWIDAVSERVAAQ